MCLEECLCEELTERHIVPGHWESVAYAHRVTEWWAGLSQLVAGSWKLVPQQHFQKAWRVYSYPSGHWPSGNVTKKSLYAGMYVTDTHIMVYTYMHLPVRVSSIFHSKHWKKVPKHQDNKRESHNWSYWKKKKTKTYLTQRNQLFKITFLDT